MSDGPDDYFGKRSGPEPTQKTNGADQGRRFRLVPFDQLRPGDGPTYLVKGLFPKGGLVVIWGPPKCGKSFWAYDVAMHIALGWQYRGRRVIPGSVIYCAFEGGEGFKGRAEAFRRRFLADHSEAVPFYLMTTPLNLARDHPLLITDIRAEHPNLQPVLVVRRLADAAQRDRGDAAVGHRGLHVGPHRLGPIRVGGRRDALAHQAHEVRNRIGRCGVRWSRRARPPWDVTRRMTRGER